MNSWGVNMVKSKIKTQKRVCGKNSTFTGRAQGCGWATQQASLDNVKL